MACEAFGQGERSSEQVIPLALASGSLWVKYSLEIKIKPFI